MPLRTTPAEYAEKWKRNTQNSRQDYEAGIDRVSEAPGKKAAMAHQKALNGYQEAITSGRWAANVQATTLEDWKSAAKGKGANRIAEGVEQAEGKVREIAEINLRNIEQVTDKVRAMPDATYQDRKARMNAYVDGMHNKKVRR